MELQFKYSLKEDFVWIFKTLRDKKKLINKKLVVFPPSFIKTFHLWLNKPKPLKIEVPFKVTCYWISAGTWGAYTPPDKIFICPWKKDGNMYSSEELKKVIIHELLHLQYYDVTKDLTFEQREIFIQDKMRNTYRE